MLKFVAIMSLLLLTAGCGKGGSSSGLGGLLSYISSSLFGGSGSTGSSGYSGGSSFFSEGSSNNGVHTVHNPEPSSMALLATGLAGFAIAQLRKRRKD